jgi:putative tricarboxylic transport membrane protein
LTLESLMFIFVGVFIGQIVGALPGIGASAGMVLLLPLTFGLDPAVALMMLAGIMYGSMYGNSLAAVLLNVPGDASSVMTAYEGNQLAKQGRAGNALGISAIASFAAGTSAVFVLAIATPLISMFALRFNAPEYFLLAAFGIIATASFGGGSALKALLVAVFGFLIAMVGIDPISGQARMTFGLPNLMEGFMFLPVAIGLFGVAEIFVAFERKMVPISMPKGIRALWPKMVDFLESWRAMIRGGIVGFLVGVMPGAGPTVAAFLAYLTEKRFSRRPDRFGKGSIDGLAATEASNNAAVTGAMVPMLSLGIPGSASTAVLLAAFVLLGIRPGPLLMTNQPELVWSLIASMFVGNLMLLVLNFPLAPFFASLLRVPYVYLAPGILVLCLVGSYVTTQSMFTVGITLVFGVIGYLMIKANLPRAPLILSLVLAPLMESSLRQSLTISRGSLWIFVERPISLALLILVMASLLWPLAALVYRRTRRGGPRDVAASSGSRS